MTDYTEKRRIIYEKYSKNLEYLILNKLIIWDNKNYEGLYLCPICLDQFCREDLNQNSKNPLTLEDVPPISLGGKSNILTCKKCNNESGHKFDSQLKEKLLELDYNELVPNTEIQLKVEKDGFILKGIGVITDDKKIKITHNEKFSNPKTLRKYVETANQNELINMNPAKRSPDDQLVKCALLKIAYLSIFEKFGYSFILDSKYDVIRKQIRFPEKKFYELNFMKDIPPASKILGIHFINVLGLESILHTFKLSSENKERYFTIFFPISSKSTIDIVNELRRRINLYQSNNYQYSFKTIIADNPKDIYLTDIQTTKRLLKWMNDVELRNSDS